MSSKTKTELRLNFIFILLINIFNNFDVFEL